MPAVLQDLLSRLFGHYKTSANGVAIQVLTWMNDHGVMLLETNAKALTVKIVGTLVGLVNLFRKDAPVNATIDNPTISHDTIRRLGVLAILILPLPFGAFKCGGTPADAERTIVAATYTAQLSVDASSKTSKAFNARGRLSLDNHKIVTIKLRGLSTAFQEFGKELEQWPTIDPSNRAALIDAATRLVQKVEATAADGDFITIDNETLSQVRRGVTIAVGLANAIRIAIATAPNQTPTNKILISEDAAKRLGADQRAFSDQDAALTQDLITIWADFLVKVKEQKGMPAATLRSWRDSLYDALMNRFAAELGRLACAACRPYEFTIGPALALDPVWMSSNLIPATTANAVIRSGTMSERIRFEPVVEKK